MMLKLSKHHIFNTAHLRSISDAKNEEGTVTGVYVTSDTGNVTYISDTSIDQICNDLQGEIEK